MEVMFMRALIGAVLVAVGASTVQAADVSTREAERIREAATVLNEIHAVPGTDIPQGLLAGINLSGGVVKPDVEDNADLYGSKASPRDVVMGGTVKAPAVTEPFMAALKRGP